MDLIATPFPSNEWRHLMNEHARSGLDELGELRVVYKALFFFVRMLQDAQYRALWEALTKRRSGGGSSMAKAMNPRNEVGAYLQTVVPDYLDWFVGWRGKRNALKDGVGFSFVGPSEDLGITFNQITEEGGVVADLSEAGSVRVGDAAEAMEQCSALYGVIRELAATTSRR
jgi:hypothetical protein